jgi:dUTP pyrophosphatase
MLKIQKLVPHAKIPTRGSPGAAGLDLYASEDTIIPAHGKGIVFTGIAVATPHWTYFRIAPRSGLAMNHSIDVLAGVVDSDYRGEIKIILYNHSNTSYNVNRGDRVAQGILESIVCIDPVEVEQLDDTLRNTNGFGSTGNG